MYIQMHSFFLWVYKTDFCTFLFIQCNNFVVGKGVKLPLHARIPILPSDECHRRYNSLPDGHMAISAVSIEASVLCATADGDENDSCQVRSHFYPRGKRLRGDHVMLSVVRTYVRMALMWSIISGTIRSRKIKFWTLIILCVRTVTKVSGIW